MRAASAADWLPITSSWGQIGDSCHISPPPDLGRGSIRPNLLPLPPWELGQRRGLWGIGLRTRGLWGTGLGTRGLWGTGLGTRGLWGRPGWGGRGAEARRDREQGTGTGRDGDGAGVTGAADGTRGSGAQPHPSYLQSPPRYMLRQKIFLLPGPP